jgi:hypothetical protein
MPRSAGDIRQGGQIDLTLTLQARQVQASLAQTAEQWGGVTDPAVASNLGDENKCVPHFQARVLG